MKISLTKSGGLLVQNQTTGSHGGIFIANCWFAKSQRARKGCWCVVAFRIGLFYVS